MLRCFKEFFKKLVWIFFILYGRDLTVPTLIFCFQASDIMISHVPNETPIEKIHQASYLQYHTSGGSLKKYGSSLQALYKYYARSGFLNILGETCD